MESIADRLGVSQTAAAFLLVLIAIQIALQLVSLVDLARRPPGTPPPGKWLWLVVVLFGNLLGAVVYLAVGRRQIVPLVGEAAAHPHDERSPDRVRAAVDELYGREDRQ